MGDSEKCIGIVVCVGVLAIIIGCCVGLSFKNVEPNEVALSWYNVGHTLDTNTLYKQGKHNIGVDHKFIKFVTQLQEVEFTSGRNPLRVRTIDGLQISVNIFFQYRIDNQLESILKLFHAFTDEYQSYFMRISRNVLRDSASRFTAFELFNNKSEASRVMRQDLFEEFSPWGIAVEQLQFTEAVLPTVFDNAIKETEATQIQIGTKVFEKEQVEQSAQGQIGKARAEADSIVNGFLQTADTLNQTTHGRTAAFEQTMAKELESLASLKQGMGFDSRELLKYVWATTMGDLMKTDGVHVLVNYAQPKDVSCFITESCT